MSDGDHSGDPLMLVYKKNLPVLQAQNGDLAKQNVTYTLQFSLTVLKGKSKVLIVY